MTDASANSDVLEYVVEIVSSYVSNNSVPAGELPVLLNNIHESLRRISGQPQEPPPEPLTPAVAVRKSVADDHIVCLEDGKTFKSLKRHLQTVHGMTPDQYRQRWGLSRDYPMVAPAYAKARSALAKGMGLGASRRRDAAENMDPGPVAIAEAVEEPAASPPQPAEDKKPRAPRRKTAKS